MAAKKKKSKSRSAAAKRGWATRRKNAAIAAKKTAAKKQIYDHQKLIKNANKGVKGKRKKPKAVSTRKKTIKELNTIIENQRKEIDLIKKSRDWEHAMPVEFLHKDGSIALEPSRLRHVEEVKDLRKFLTKHNRKGQLDWAANELAGLYNIPLREVYTLWYSP